MPRLATSIVGGITMKDHDNCPRSTLTNCYRTESGLDGAGMDESGPWEASGSGTRHAECWKRVKIKKNGAARGRRFSSYPSTEICVHPFRRRQQPRGWGTLEQVGQCADNFIGFSASAAACVLSTTPPAVPRGMSRAEGGIE
jgi:hypothetical protein